MEEVKKNLTNEELEQAAGGKKIWPTCCFCGYRLGTLIPDSETRTSRTTCYNCGELIYYWDTGTWERVIK